MNMDDWTMGNCIIFRVLRSWGLVVGMYMRSLPGLSPGLLSIMPNRPVRVKWDYPRKMERHFPIKPRQPIGIALATILSFPNSLIRAKNRFVKNGTVTFDRNIPTEISGPPPEVIPNIPVGRNRNGPLHLNSDRNFRNLWHNGKHPLFRQRITTGSATDL